MADHSASFSPLVGFIAVLLYPQHCRVWIIGRHSKDLWNYWAIRRLLLFTTDLILSFRAQLTGTKGEDGTCWRHAEWVRRFSGLHFFDVSATFVPLC
ncbi:hypothetical protein H5410_031078 [Solanum commersonii]|uniref:Uncharacterized protein n=1 Tax=Solanum commersonii TaxID=4109 RepID=A0A9J5YKL9_SOLCO|nr:hypothetical protein H5410_031078 [Solanum commersonii]